MHEVLVKDRLKDISSLPTLPVIISKLITALQDEASSIYDISEILRYDQSLASRVVAVANSPSFGYPGRINSIDQAILMLGFDMVKSISLGVSVFGFLPPQSPAARQMWAHSYGVAVLSGLMCSRIPVADKGVCFLSGLLHDIGRVVLLKLYRDEYARLSDTRELLSAEREMFQCNHAQAGGWFLESLSFPDETILSVRHHHGISPDMAHKGIATGVYLSEGLISLLNPELACDGKWTEEHKNVFEENGLGEHDIKEFSDFLKGQEKIMTDFFEL